MGACQLAGCGGSDLVLPIEPPNRKRTYKQRGRVGIKIRRILAHSIDQAFGLGRRGPYAASAGEAARTLSRGADRLADYAGER